MRKTVQQFIYLGSKGQRSRSRVTKASLAWVFAFLWVLASSSFLCTSVGFMFKLNRLHNGVSQSAESHETAEFYRATLCWRGICCRCVSVCLSVCHWNEESEKNFIMLIILGIYRQDALRQSICICVGLSSPSTS